MFLQNEHSLNQSKVCQAKQYKELSLPKERKILGYSLYHPKSKENETSQVPTEPTASLLS